MQLNIIIQEQNKGPSTIIYSPKVEQETQMASANERY